MSDVARLGSGSVWATDRRDIALLDSGPDENLDRLTRLAAELTGAPTVLMSLADDQCQRLASRYDVADEAESLDEPTGAAFCRFVASGGERVVSNDASVRPESATLDVMEAFGIRAYVGVPLRDDAGRGVGAFCAVDHLPRPWSERDLKIIDELAHAAMREIKLRRAAAEARALLSAREELIAVVAHDLRTPLSVITMYAQLLAREALPEKAANMVERLRRTSGGMSQLIKSLLDISQIEAQSLVPNLRDATPLALLTDAVEQHAAEAERLGCELQIDCADGLPALKVDYERLMRVFDNLIDNALKFSKPPGPVTVAAALGDDAKSVRFLVSDRGEGLEQASLDGLMSRFWAAKLHERRGSGFGLAIAGGIVRALGGKLDARTEPGVGSEFSFSLPVAPA